MNKKNLGIRRFTQADIPFVVARCCEEIPTLPTYRSIEVDETHLRYTLESNINNDAHLCGWVLHDETDYIYGGLLGYCVKLLFSKAYMTGDVFFFIREDCRSLPNATKLMRAYKDWAIARGAKLITATHTGGLRTEGMDRLLKSQGYVPVGTIYHLRRD